MCDVYSFNANSQMGMQNKHDSLRLKSNADYLVSIYMCLASGCQTQSGVCFQVVGIKLSQIKQLPERHNYVHAEAPPLKTRLSAIWC